LTFALFGLDKSRAVQGGWRIPERTLLMIAFLGGWPGAKVAQRGFRHKTRKQPFARLLNLVPVGWAILVGVGAVSMHGPAAVRSNVVLTDVAEWVDETVASVARPEAEGTRRDLPRRFGPGSQTD
jgi:uncharacterized membrane protein YsdA (DUF1294 family)